MPLSLNAARAHDPLEDLPISLGYFRLLLRAFGEAPAARASILQGTGVDEVQLADPAADISLLQQLRQIDNLTALLGEGWPFTAPDLFGTASHGALGVAAITAPDVAGAMKVIARFSYVRAAFATRRLVQRSADWIIEVGPSIPVSETRWRTLNEINFLGIRAVLATVIGRPPRGARYRFTGPAPAYLDQVRAVLGEDVTFGEAVAAFVLPRDELAVGSPYADPGLHARAVEELDQALARLSGPASLRMRVQRLLLTNPVGRLDSAAAAKALGVSRRTLVRRLGEADCAYRDLLDAELRSRARRLLEDGALSRAEISDRLGYADPTSFSRACRRWFAGEASRYGT